MPTVTSPIKKGFAPIFTADKRIRTMNKCVDEKEVAFDRLKTFRSLTEGWDGYSAFPITIEVISAAQSLLEKIPAVPEVFPTVAGNVQFQFEDDKGNYLELEIKGNDKVEMFAEIEGVAQEERIVNLGDDTEWECLMKLIKVFA